MSINEPSVWILVLNYCSLEDTLGCVESIRKVNYDHLHLLVIDNASPDGSGNSLSEIIPANEFLALPSNIGYAGGNNEAIRIAVQQKAQYIFIVNPDIRIAHASIKQYVSILEADKSIGALNPIQLSADGKSIDEKFYSSVLKKQDISFCHTNKTQHLWEVDTLFGASLMLPVSTIKNVGVFDPLYFAYGEEEDLCRRIKYHNFKLVVTAQSPVIHLRTKESDTVTDFVLFLRLKGSYLFKLKDPILGYRYAVKKVFKDIILDLMGKRGNTYPFNAYPIRFKFILKSILWIILNFNQIRMSRKIEKKGCAHT